MSNGFFLVFVQHRMGVGPTCSEGWVRLLGFDGEVKAHRGFHTHGLASAVLALVLMLLQVDFGRVKGHVGTELRNVSGPGRGGRTSSVKKAQQTGAFWSVSALLLHKHFLSFLKQPPATGRRDRAAAKSIFSPLATRETQFSHSLAAPPASRKCWRTKKFAWED